VKIRPRGSTDVTVSLGAWCGLLLVLLASCSSAAGPSTAASSLAGSNPSATTPGPSATSAPESRASDSPPSLTVTSTLDGHTALPHRIHWIAKPSGLVSEVDFLIDGEQLWVEHNAPYSYGDDGNYLVTSFLTAGNHDFTVRAIGLQGQTATDAVTATVPLAPQPPSALAGTWKSFQTPVGTASLIVNSEGWYMGSFPVNHHTGGNRVDVAYLAPGLVEVRTGMATGHDLVSGSSNDDDLNGWCNDAPGSPARYRWAVSGAHLHLTFMSGDPCSGFTRFLEAVWTRGGR
jgi:hypothetical protein